MILAQSDSANPCSETDSKIHNWPVAIALTEYSDGSDIEDGPADFSSNSKHIDHILSGPLKTQRSRPEYGIEVTFVGELRSRPGIQIMRSREGWYAGDGYGQSGQYPALLVLKDVRDAHSIKRANGNPND
jgi:hypothetical protein